MDHEAYLHLKRARELKADFLEAKRVMGSLLTQHSQHPKVSEHSRNWKKLWLDGGEETDNKEREGWIVENAAEYPEGFVAGVRKYQSLRSEYFNLRRLLFDQAELREGFDREDLQITPY